jgi:hypothetical protein
MCITENSGVGISNWPRNGVEKVNAIRTLHVVEKPIIMADGIIEREEGAGVYAGFSRAFCIDICQAWT